MLGREQAVPPRLEKCRPGCDMVGHQVQFLITEGNHIVPLVRLLIFTCLLSELNAYESYLYT